MEKPSSSLSKTGRTFDIFVYLLYRHQKPNYTVVFQHGEGGYPCIRIPSIARCGSTLHAFAECRTRIGDGCIPTGKEGLASVLYPSLCYKNSTDDGATWSPLLPLAANAVQPTVVCDSYKAAILLQFNANNSNWQISSHDNGGHWSLPQAIDLGLYNGTYVGPGVGLQLSEDSQAPGRLLFIGHHGPYEYDIIWYSDDHGDTYQLGKTTLLYMDEAQLVELDNGMIMANMRNNHLNPCDCRGVSLSLDSGETFGNITFDPTLISPVCMATILRTGNGSLLFANPASKTSRVNGLVRRSDDDWSNMAVQLPCHHGRLRLLLFDTGVQQHRGGLALGNRHR
eukprot:Em0014g830a